MTDAISWYVDGRPIQFGDWTADCTAFGGYRDFSGTCSASASRFAQQQSEIAGYRRDGTPFWFGKLTLDPEINQDSASIVAEGTYKGTFSTLSERLFFSAQVEADWKLATVPPYSYTQPGSTYDVKVQAGSLPWSIAKGTAASIGDAEGYVIWFEGANLTNLNAILSNAGGGGARSDWRVSTAFGPNGARTQEGALIGAGAPSIDRDLTLTGGDLVSLEIVRNSNAAVNSREGGQAASVEVRGLATASEFTAADVLAVLMQFGPTPSVIDASSLNMMPLDWQGTRFDLAMSIVQKADWWFMILGRTDLTVASAAGPWTDVLHVARARNARATLTPLRRYNRVRVQYATNTDDHREAVGIAEPDPFPGQTVEFLAEPIADKQRDGVLAQNVADTLVARYSKPRRTGSIQVAQAIRDDGRRLTAYGILPGQLVDITDHDPLLPPQRIQTVKWDKSGIASMDIETEVSAAKVLVDAGGSRPPIGGRPGSRARNN